jgi:AraC-like DNA-binding protein
MERATELTVALPGLRAVRTTTVSPHAGVKEHYSVGRIERGTTEWWGGGTRWRSGPGSIVVKQPGDALGHVALDGPTTFTAIRLPIDDVEQARAIGGRIALAQLAAGDARAAPFHRLIDGVCAGADRLSLEVAVAEVTGALVAIDAAHPGPPRAVRRAQAYLRARFAEPITLAELAAHAGLDKFHLCRAFRAQIGLPPYAYLTQLRVAHAKHLLRRGVRASEIAPLVGFCDQAQLTRTFRRLVGTTPARYGARP